MDLATFHTTLLCTPPTERQQALYDAAATMRGYGEETLSGEAEATFILALHMLRGAKSDAAVLLFVPSGMVEVMQMKVRSVFNTVSQQLKPLTNPVSRGRAEKILERFNRVRVGTRRTWPDIAPEYWVAFGLGRPENPAWLRNALL